MVLSGVFVNSAAVIAGGLLGAVLKKGIPENTRNLVMQGLALGVLFVGISGVAKGHNTIFIILSLTLGAAAGDLADFDRHIHGIGERIQNHLAGASSSSFVTGFTSCTLFVCPGAMAIVGALESGLTGSAQVLYAKAVIDLVFAAVMASSLGLGVCLASVSVLLYEAALTVGASFLSVLLTPVVIDEMACTGSILVIALGLNMLKITNVKLANLILAPFVPILLYQIAG